MAEANCDLKEITECPICLEPFTNPKCLPCIHTFCLQCLQNHLQATDSSQTVTCPTCRQVFDLPNGKLEDLPNNYFMYELVQALDKQDSCATTKLEIICDFCEETKASKFCIDCDQHYCEKDAERHPRIKGFDKHELINVEDKSQIVVDKIQPILSLCNVHKNKEKDIFCVTCECLVCKACASAEHKTHTFAVIGTACKEFKSCIDIHKSHIHQHRTDATNKIEKVTADKAIFLEDIKLCQNKIDQRCHRLKRLINLQCQQFKTELDEIKKSGIKLFDTRLQGLELSNVSIENFDIYLQALSSKASPSALFSSQNDVETKMKSLEDDVKKALADEYKARVSFVESDIEDIRNLSRQLIGQIYQGNTESKACMWLMSRNENNPYQPIQYSVELDKIDTVENIQSSGAMLGSETAGCAIGCDFYIVGVGEYCNQLWKVGINHPNYKWARCADMPETGRRRHCAEVVGDKIYVLGGFKDAAGMTLSSIVCYNVQLDEWSPAGSLHTAARNCGSLVYKKCIYVFGGVGSNDANLSCVQQYDIDHQATTVLTDMPKDCRLLRAALWEASAILVGSRICFIYNFETKKWSERSEYITGYSHFGLLLYNDTLFIAGGAVSHNDGNNKTLWWCSDKVRKTSVRNILDNKPVGWKHHAKLPKVACVSAFNKTAMLLTK